MTKYSYDDTIIVFRKRRHVAHRCYVDETIFVNGEIKNDYLLHDSSGLFAEYLCRIVEQKKITDGNAEYSITRYDIKE